MKKYRKNLFCKQDGDNSVVYANIKLGKFDVGVQLDGLKSSESNYFDDFPDEDLARLLAINGICDSLSEVTVTINNKKFVFEGEELIQMVEDIIKMKS